MSLNDQPDLQRVTANAAVRFKRLRSYISKLSSNGVPLPTGQLPRVARPFSDREPKAFADLVDDFSEIAGFTEQLSVTGLTFNWAEIVGPELAGHLEVEEFDLNSGILTLKASSTAWATQVRFLTNQLLARISEEVGADVVREITVLGPNAPSWKHGLRSVKGRGPRDTYG